MRGSNNVAPDAEGDTKLSVLLREWRGVEPSAGFEAAVWGRIRSEAMPHPAGGWAYVLDWMLPHPVWAGAATALVALLVGVATALTVPGRAHGAPTAHHALLQPGTMAGTYLALSERGHP